MSTPAGWYDAPGDDTQIRYWDGISWTDHYLPKEGQTRTQSPVNERVAVAPTPPPATPEPPPTEAEDTEEIDPKSLRPDIAQAVKGVRTGGRREIKRVVHHLHEGETVDKIATCAYGGGIGIVVLTDRRLFFFKDGWTSKTSEDFPFSRISSINWHSGMLTGQIDVHVQGLKAEIKSVNKDAGKLIVDRVRHHIAKGDAPTADTPAVAPVAPAGTEPDVYEQLRKLGELKDAGLLTEEEFQAKRAALVERL